MINLKSFNSLLDLIMAFPNEESCIRYLEQLRWGQNIISPFDKTSTVYRCRNNRYKCKNTNKYFNVKTETIFEGSNVPLQKWFLAMYLAASHKKGISSYQLGKDINVTQKTAWFMLHRIRMAMRHSLFTKTMSGIVEADETFVGGKNGNRHKDKKVPKAQGRSFKDKTPVFGLLQRNGDLYAQVVKDTKATTIQPIVHKIVTYGSALMTDEWTAYRGLSKYYDHSIVDHTKKQYVQGDIYTNSLEGAWSWLKRMIMGIYHRISRKHLQLYVDEFVFKYNSRKFKDALRFSDLLNQSFGTRLTYKELRYAK